MTDLLQQMAQATVAGDEPRCVALAQEALDAGMDPFEVIQKGYARGMQVIGDKFSVLECFLPEVILAADAMNAAVQILKPHLMEREDRGSRGTIVIGTIQGDLHDLGKNIVKIMLQAAGFTVHDLGADVPVRRLIDKAQEVGADIIAASAILTTTMSYMPDIASILAELGLRDKYRIMLGGAPVIEDWAKAAGADGYGVDAAEGVTEAIRLMYQKAQGGKND